MNKNTKATIRTLAVLIAALTFLAIVAGLAHATEPAPNACARQGNLICPNPAFKVAIARLGNRPALILPGQWVEPDGNALVFECLSSYPNSLADKGIPNRELMNCLWQPDPRLTDRRVMTVNHYHRLHVLHLAHVRHIHR